MLASCVYAAGIVQHHPLSPAGSVCAGNAGNVCDVTCCCVHVWLCTGSSGDVSCFAVWHLLSLADATCSGVLVAAAVSRL